ncbi:MAG TPA: uracil-DNA glycosylase, partial [Anaerolineaceae bacterium]|nr:uracil-DNA glycosylase [Anaerolineaceae bacterium]
PMYHPAAALHQPSLKSTIEQDFSRLPELLKNFKRSRPVETESTTEEKPSAGEKKSSDTDNAVQLSLF